MSLFNLIADADMLMASVPAWIKIVGWAALSGAVSMGLYAKLSPQRALREMKGLQQSSRQALYRYDGSLADMYPLIGRDLLLALKQLTKVALPALLAMLPVFYVVSCVGETYPQDWIPLGPHWFRSTEFLYLAALTVVSLTIKAKFQIV